MLEMGVIGGDGGFTVFSVVVVDDRMRWDSNIDITITTERRLKVIPYGVLNRGLRIRDEGRVVEDLL